MRCGPGEVARWLVVAVALSTSAGACRGGEGGPRDRGGERVDPDERESPLDEFFGSTGEIGLARVADQQRRVEEAIALCMQAQGFDYTPVETDSSQPDEGPWGLPQDEFAEKYGYGMFTIDHGEGGGEPNDPNQERVDAMSEAERIAYNTALWGTQDEETGVGSGGCHSEAWDAEEAGIEDEFQALFDDLEAMYSRIERVDRVKDAARDWADCMADAGYPDLERPSSASELVQDRYDEMGPAVEGPASSEDGEAVPDGENFGLDPEDLEELRAYEIEVAVADDECRGEYDEIYFHVQSELEQEFVVEHREELENYRDAYSTVSG